MQLPLYALREQCPLPVYQRIPGFIYPLYLFLCQAILLLLLPLHSCSGYLLVYGGRGSQQLQQRNPLALHLSFPAFALLFLLLLSLSSPLAYTLSHLTSIDSESDAKCSSRSLNCLLLHLLLQQWCSSASSGGKEEGRSNEEEEEGNG